MRSTKPYTNTTFTKRVDHEAGRHRAARAPSEPRQCTACGAVYSRRRWLAAADPRAAEIVATVQAAPALCPACRSLSSVPAGFLRVEGAFYQEHQADIERLIEREVERAQQDNPLGRIMTRDRSAPGVLLVTTTTEHLVQRLGHALEKAYSGHVDYQFSHENKVARVTWHRP